MVLNSSVSRTNGQAAPPVAQELVGQLEVVQRVLGEADVDVGAARRDSAQIEELRRPLLRIGKAAQEAGVGVDGELGHPSLKAPLRIAACTKLIMSEPWSTSIWRSEAEAGAWIVGA